MFLGRSFSSPSEFLVEVRIAPKAPQGKLASGFSRRTVLIPPGRFGWFRARSGGLSRARRWETVINSIKDSRGKGFVFFGGRSVGGKNVKRKVGQRVLEDFPFFGRDAAVVGTV